MVDPATPRDAPQREPAAGQRLASAYVLVIGAGRLGGAVLPALAAAGVGTIAIVDDGTVDASALARQTIHGRTDVGRSKADSAADALERLAPGVRVIRHPERFAPGRSFDLLLDADLLVDGSGDSATHYLANDAAAVRGIPMVWGSASGFSGEVGVAWDEKGIDYRDLYPEPAEGTADSDAGGRDVAAALPTVAAVIGGMMASEAVKLLTGIGEPLIGRTVGYDALTGSTTERAYRRAEGAPRPGSLEERTTIREPDPSRSVTPEQLAKLLAGPTTHGIHETPPLLLDVRERAEASFVSLPGSTLIPLGELPDRIDELDHDAPIVVYCHHGVRSGRALALLEKAGFTRVRHLTGGIDGYAVKVDPALPRY